MQADFVKSCESRENVRVIKTESVRWTKSESWNETKCAKELIRTIINI